MYKQLIFLTNFINNSVAVLGLGARDNFLIVALGLSWGVSCLCEVKKRTQAVIKDLRACCHTCQLKMNSVLITCFEYFTHFLLHGLNRNSSIPKLLICDHIS